MERRAELLLHDITCIGTKRNGENTWFGTLSITAMFVVLYYAAPVDAVWAVRTQYAQPTCSVPP